MIYDQPTCSENVRFWKKIWKVVFLFFFFLPLLYFMAFFPSCLVFDWHTAHALSRVKQWWKLHERLAQLRSHKWHFITDHLKPCWANSKIFDLSHSHNHAIQECLIWSHLISTLNQNTVILWVISPATASDKLPGAYSWEFYWCRASGVKPWIETVDPCWFNVLLDVVTAASLDSWIKVCRHASL